MVYIIGSGVLVSILLISVRPLNVLGLGFRV
jgi:hypothetical protein